MLYLNQQLIYRYYIEIILVMPDKQCADHQSKNACYKHRKKCHWTKQQECESWNGRCNSLTDRRHCKSHRACRWNKQTNKCSYNSRRKRSLRRTRRVKIQKLLTESQSDTYSEPSVATSELGVTSPAPKDVSEKTQDEPQSAFDLELERAREVDLARTFQISRQLKSMAYRVKMSEGVLTRSIPLSGMQPDKPFIIDPSRMVDPIGPVPCDFQEFVSEHSGKIKYLGSGVYGHAFKICPDQTCQPEFSIKLVTYDCDYTEQPYEYPMLSVTDPVRPENIEYLMPNLLCQYLIPSQTDIISPHISLPVLAFRCPFTDQSVQALLQSVRSRDYQKYRDAKRFYVDSHNRLTNPKQNPKSEVLIYVSEFARRGDFNSWLQEPSRTTDDLRIAIFQLVFTMACIQSIDPSFRHNDMSLTNVLIQEVEIPEGYADHLYHYQFEQQHFLIPIQNFSLRLWDFDFANSQFLPNRKVFVGPPTVEKVYNFYEEYGILEKGCLQYDLHYFLNWLREYTAFYNNKIRDRDISLHNYIDSWTRFTRWDKSFTIERQGGRRQKVPAVTTSSRLSFVSQKILGRATEPRKKRSLFASKHKQDIYTYCHSENGPVKIPFREFTAAHSIVHCAIFSQFRVTEQQVTENQDKILAHYKYPSV